jgi:hypothetical protein
VEMSNHLYHWIPEELLEAYIGWARLWTAN